MRVRASSAAAGPHGYVIAGKQIAVPSGAVARAMAGREAH
jgi:hypothetical protein